MMTTENNAMATLTDGQKIEVSCANIINPGDWFGKRWAILVSYGYSGDWYIIEAGCESDAIDELVESGKVNGLIIDKNDMDDYIQVTIDGEQMDVTDARRRFPDMEINAVIQAGRENGDTTDSCHYTGEGTPYDIDWIHAIDPVESIEFPVSDEDASTKGEIVSSVARTAFACDWADAIENAPESIQDALPSLSGVDIMDVCPFDRMPAEYLKWADKSVRDVEGANGCNIVTILKRMDPTSEDAQHFGHYLAMQLAGSGVGLWDEYEATGGEDVSVPSTEFPQLVDTDNILNFIGQ